MAVNEKTVTWAGDDISDPMKVLERALELYHPNIALASSFGLEDVALIHMLHSINPESRVFSLDTGRLNDETYECAENISRRYGVRIEWYFPAREDVESLERTKGLYSFRLSVENRKECCGIRKVEPLNRALSGLDAWITGQRKAQSVTRTELTVVEEDVVHGGIAKINPLADWSLDQVKNFVREHSIPYNNLHERGYPSIGCAPCTRAVAPGENERAGRWWWEHPEHKECGLHLPFQQGDGI